MKWLKLFEDFGLDIVEEIDNWIESNSDYISASSLEDKIGELLESDEVEAKEETIKEEGEYGEDWSTKVICVKYKGEDLMKVCVNSSGVYDFGKNTTMFEKLPSNQKHTAPFGFGVRFFFDKNLIKNN